MCIFCHQSKKWGLIMRGVHMYPPTSVILYSHTIFWAEQSFILWPIRILNKINRLGVKLWSWKITLYLLPRNLEWLKTLQLMYSKFNTKENSSNRRKHMFGWIANIFLCFPGMNTLKNHQNPKGVNIMAVRYGRDNSSATHDESGNHYNCAYWFT